MRILLVTPKFYPLNFSCNLIAEELLNSGHYVDVLTADDSDISEYKGIHIYRVKTVKRKNSFISLARNYLSFEKNGKHWISKCKSSYDVIYSFQLTPVTMLAIGDKYKQTHPETKHVGHILDIWPDSVIQSGYVKEGSHIYKKIKKIGDSLYKKLDSVVVSSPSFSNYLEEELNISKDKISFVNQPSIIECPAKDESLHITNCFNIVYAGNIGKMQNLEMLIDVMKILENENVCFHIVGTGSLKKTLLDTVIQKGLGNVIKFYGYQNAENTASIISSCNLCYLSLKSSGYVGKTIPNKLMMYMALSKPILVVNEGDTKLLLENHKGIMFSEENAEDIASKIQYIKNKDKKELTEMGELNYKYYYNNFDVEKVCKKLISIFSK